MVRLKKIKFYGQSMDPILKNGHPVILKNFTDIKTIEVGDIVCFVDNESGELVNHRYVSQGMIKGDRNTSCDDYKMEDIQGVIVGQTIGKKVYYWGERGFLLKRIIAKLSMLGTRKKLIRYPSLLLLITLNYLSKLALRKPPNDVLHSLK